MRVAALWGQKKAAKPLIPIGLRSFEHEAAFIT